MKTIVLNLLWFIMAYEAMGQSYQKVSATPYREGQTLASIMDTIKIKSQKDEEACNNIFKDRLYVSSEITGELRGYILKKNPDDVFYSSVNLALMPLYRIGKFSMGPATEYMKSNYLTVKSLGFSANYRYGKKTTVTYIISGRVYYNFMKETIRFT